MLVIDMTERGQGGLERRSPIGRIAMSCRGHDGELWRRLRLFSALDLRHTDGTDDVGRPGPSWPNHSGLRGPRRYRVYRREDQDHDGHLMSRSQDGGVRNKSMNPSCEKEGVDRR